MSDFNGEDYDFAAGAIYGMRSWNMDDLGRLHGVTHEEVWRPGENVSVCKKSREIPCPNPAAAPRDDRLPSGTVPTQPKRKGRRGREMEVLAPWERELLYGTPSGLGRCGDPSCYRGIHTVKSDHSFDANCQCGFWAYDEHAFTEHGAVTGIIEGYGKTTIGTRGFRSEKARIVALCRERDNKPPSLSTWLRLQQLYPEATFFEVRDEMVSQYGGVLRKWSEVGEDFWERQVPKCEEPSMSAMLSSYRNALARYSFPTTFGVGGGV